ncbi:MULTISPECIES: peroxide/acid stress response protein YhcN [Enterobacter]|uniref:peroxide/acid stress response protein YhcN n=1 Tax=Enterobacter TaxID=547 RepID=UPI001886D745|nr:MULTISPECIES: peroxide/acid stress response protein YhcN [Enterobacter]MBF2791701.1 peroxide/acid stress response protein YhcN [Enterobacter asburiae]
MKIKSTVAALSVLSVLSVLSFGAFAADSINADQAQSRQAIGTVSVGAVGTSPMDMHEMLNKKAEEQGASSYRVIEARSGDHWHATAELYK